MLNVAKSKSIAPADKFEPEVSPSGSEPSAVTPAAAEVSLDGATFPSALAAYRAMHGAVPTQTPGVVVDGLNAGLSNGTTLTRSAASGTLDALGEALDESNGLLARLRGRVGQLFRGDVLGSTLGATGDILSSGARATVDAFSFLGHAVSSIGSSIWNGVSSFFGGLFG